MFESFWMNTSAWPRDPSGHVFLGRAFHQIGKAKFGDQWTGKEGAIRLPELLPDLLSPWDTASDVNARALLSLDGTALSDRMVKVARERSRVAAIARIASGMGGAKPKEPEENMDLTVQEWARAKELNRAEYDAALPFAQRATAVQSLIIDGCEGGKLTAVYRSKAGGEMTPMPPVWWNSDQGAVRRFYCCDVRPDDPYWTKSDQGEFSWIFVTADSLANFLSQLPNSDIRAHYDMHLSPYLALMLSVAKKLRITPENQPKIVTIEAELRAAWTLPKPLSESLVGAMATALREIDSQGGRNNKKKKPA